MTIKAAWVQQDSYSARNDRHVLTALMSQTTTGTLRARGGVVRILGTELQVTQTGSASMSVLVGAGQAHVRGTNDTAQGMYVVTNDGAPAVSKTASPSSSANPRIDSVILRVLDEEQADGSHASDVQIIAGSPSSSPVPPVTPKSSVLLAYLAVGQNAITITNANITDKRDFAAALGGVVPVRNRTEAAALGLTIGTPYYDISRDMLGWMSGTGLKSGRPDAMGVTAPSSDAGGIVQIAHGLGAAPTFFTGKEANQSTELLNQLVRIITWTSDATFIRFKAYRLDTNAILPSNPINIAWQVWL